MRMRVYAEPRIQVFHPDRNSSVLLDCADLQLLFVDSDGRYWKTDSNQHPRLFADDAVELLRVVRDGSIKKEQQSATPGDPMDGSAEVSAESPHRDADSHTDTD